MHSARAQAEVRHVVRRQLERAGHLEERALHVALVRQELGEQLAGPCVLRLARDQRAQRGERRRHLSDVGQLPRMLQHVGAVRRGPPARRTKGLDARDRAFPVVVFVMLAGASPARGLRARHAAATLLHWRLRYGGHRQASASVVSPLIHSRYFALPAVTGSASSSGTLYGCSSANASCKRLESRRARLEQDDDLLLVGDLALPPIERAAAGQHRAAGDQSALEQRANELHGLVR